MHILIHIICILYYYLSAVPSSDRTLSVSTTSITVTVIWRCTGATKYFIFYTNADSSHPETSVAVSTFPATIRNLLANTTYRFRVACENAYGRATLSGPVTVQTSKL